jgi:hypothetical protein
MDRTKSPGHLPVLWGEGPTTTQPQSLVKIPAVYPNGPALSRYPAFPGIADPTMDVVDPAAVTQRCLTHDVAKDQFCAEGSYRVAASQLTDHTYFLDPASRRRNQGRLRTGTGATSSSTINSRQSEQNSLASTPRPFALGSVSNANRIRLQSDAPLRPPPRVPVDVRSRSSTFPAAKRRCNPGPSPLRQVRNACSIHASQSVIDAATGHDSEAPDVAHFDEEDIEAQLQVRRVNAIKKFINRGRKDSDNKQHSGLWRCYIVSVILLSVFLAFLVVAVVAILDAQI